MAKVIYLTGAPATGKSTLTRNLNNKEPDTVIFTYSKELADWISQKRETLSSQEDLRRESAAIITREDVNQVDQQLLDLVKTKRDTTNIVIDSHPVTIEKYGFRITPFSKEQLAGIKPDVIVCLYAEATVISERIKKDAAGRPLPTSSQLDFHMNLQAQVASQYALDIGASLYFLNADCSPGQLLENFLRVTKFS